MTTRFPIHCFSGTPKEIGFQHGSELKEKIHKTIDFYRRVFGLDEGVIFEKAEHFKDLITKFNSDYADEIEAIALGAEVDPLWIYAINSRTEIMSCSKDIEENECTSAFFKSSSLLGQTWDWAQDFEDLAFVAKINDSTLTVTEPGMLAKIGLNKFGIGVCLNFLRSEVELKGLPIHILLRAILDSESIEDAKKIIEIHKYGKASHILLGDSEGNYCSVEFANNRVFYSSTLRNLFVHTNHYLSPDITNNKEKIVNSFTRFERAGEIVESIEGGSFDDMKSLLLDNSREDYPILRSFTFSKSIGSVGTVTCVIMDLKRCEIEMTKGSPLHTKFEVISLD